MKNEAGIPEDEINCSEPIGVWKSKTFLQRKRFVQILAKTDCFVLTQCYPVVDPSSHCAQSLQRATAM